MHADKRGDFRETWNVRVYHEHGFDVSFVQDNLSRSRPGVLRGLHFQNPRPQGKLITVLQGSVYEVFVDIRSESETFGQWQATTLSAGNGCQLYVPEGFANGFVVTSRTEVLFHYKCTAFYAPDAGRTIRWDDPALGIDWPVDDPVLSDRDRTAPGLESLPENLFAFDAAEADP